MADLTNEQLSELQSFLIDIIVESSKGNPEDVLQGYLSHIAIASSEPHNVVIPTLVWMILAEAFVQDPVTMVTFWKSIKQSAAARGFPLHKVYTPEQVNKLIALANATAKYNRG